MLWNVPGYRRVIVAHMRTMPVLNRMVVMVLVLSENRGAT